MLSWLTKLFERRAAPLVRPPEHPEVQAAYDDKMITVRDADGNRSAMAWVDLASVTITTTDAGPFAVDLFWVLTDREARRGPTIPMGAEGEHELLKAMQARLAGFDNMVVIEAMGSTGNGSFLVWDQAKREQSAGYS